MKKSKKKYSDPQEMLIDKLLDLKFRINEAYSSYPCDENENDRSWVMDRCDDVRNGETLSKGELMKANNLWKDYYPSRLNNWESSRD